MRLGPIAAVCLCVLLLLGGCCVRGDLPGPQPTQPKRLRAPANWSIGILQGPTLTSLKPRPECPNPRLTKGDITSPVSDFVADPFLVREGDTWVLFFELFNRTSAKGEIGVAESKDLCTWDYRGVVLAESFHLSYPHVFKVGDEYFMVPESKQAGEIRLYKAEQFPLRWRFDSSLIHGEFSDATPFFWRDRWWIFANRAPYALVIFSSPTLRGRYVEHPESPLFDGDAGRARPAGRIVMSNGVPHRFVQDNRDGYGKRVRMVRVAQLSRGRYREEIRSPDPLLKEQAGWNGFGMHHLSAVKLDNDTWVAAVDGNER